MSDETGHCGESVEIGKVGIRAGIHDVAPKQGEQNNGPYDCGQLLPGKPGYRNILSNLGWLEPMIPAIRVQPDVHHMQDGIRVQAGHKKDVHIDRHGDNAERPGNHLFPGEEPDMDQPGKGSDQFEWLHGSKVTVTGKFNFTRVLSCARVIYSCISILRPQVSKTLYTKNVDR